MLSKQEKTIVLFLGAVALGLAILGIYSYRTGETLREIIFSPRSRIGTGAVSLSTSFNKTLAIKQSNFPDKICNIKNYGAIENDKMSDTRAISDAIEDCASSGGGKVVVPEGHWTSGTIRLKNNINLNLEKNAVIDFSTDLNDYLPVVFSRYEGVEYYNYSPPIYTKDCNNVAISGKGTLNGQADKSWWKMDILASQKKLYGAGHDDVPVEKRIFGTPEAGLRPAFIEFSNCDTVNVEGVTIINSPMWTVHPLYSKNITISGIKIKTDPGKNTDGIVIDSSENVLVESSDISTGDDSIVLKSGRDHDGLRVNRPTQNVVIRDCNVTETHAGLAIGSEVSGGVANVDIRNCTIGNSQFGLRLKSAPGRGGYIKNIWVSDIKIDSSSISAIDIDSLYQGPFKEDETTPTEFSNINLKNISAQKAKGSINIIGAENNILKNITLDNIRIGSNNGPVINYSQNLSMDKITLIAKKNPVLNLDNVTDAKITDYACSQNQDKECILISGENSANINIRSNGQKIDEKKINFDNVSSNVLVK